MRAALQAVGMRKKAFKGLHGQRFIPQSRGDDASTSGFPTATRCIRSVFSAVARALVAASTCFLAAPHPARHAAHAADAPVGARRAIPAPGLAMSLLWHLRRRSSLRC